jgi:hypothetical protein
MPVPLEIDGAGACAPPAVELAGRVLGAASGALAFDTLLAAALVTVAAGGCGLLAGACDAVGCVVLAGARLLCVVLRKDQL